MPRSEIDDIFASKGKRSSAQPVASSSAPTAAVPKKKKKSSKRKREVEHEDVAAEEEKPRKRPVPETVVDPSIALTAPAPKAQAIRAPAAKAAVKPKAGKKDQINQDQFSDSRGSGPSVYFLFFFNYFSSSTLFI